jgi:hypothetical protein
MADDDYVEGDSNSEAASAPETDKPARDAKQGGFDSGSVSDAPVMHRPSTAARLAESRKAFAAAVIANKDKPAAKAVDHDILDPDEPIAAIAEIAKLKAETAPEAKPPAHAAPPAPSLDPEVRALRESLKSERDAIAKERAELEKQRAKPAEATAPSAPLSAPDLESYIDHPPTAYRNWLEGIRGEKFANDDEFKTELSDFITMASSDVLGVPLPENVRAKLEAAQAKKMVRTHKTIMSRKEAEAKTRAEREQVEATTKAETERMETEWKKAGESLSAHMRTDVPAKTYPWLAAEDDPGAAIVDVIRSQLAKDGTSIAWEEAAKLANDYLAENAKRYYDKRRPLLSSEPAKPAAVAAKPAAAAPVAAPPPPVATTPSGNQKWSNDKHREQTRAAFRAQIEKAQ